MKKTILLMCVELFAFASCTKASNEFIINDPENAISSAEIRLCGKRIQLAKSKGEVRGRMAITCEGAGSILIRVSDGHETVCRIGYVTPGAEQIFEFVIEKGQCQSSVPLHLTKPQ